MRRGTRPFNRLRAVPSAFLRDLIRPRLGDIIPADARLLRGDPIDVGQSGIATEEILSFAEAHKVNPIVMATYGLRGLDRLMLGTVTCPVLAVHIRFREA